MLIVRCFCCAILFVFCWLPLGTASAQTDFSWNGTAGAFSNANQWSPTGGPPTSADNALFQAGSSFTVSGNGTALRLDVAVSDVTFTGAISPTGSLLAPAVIIGPMSSAGSATFDGSSAALNAGSVVAIGPFGASSLTFSDGATGTSQGISGGSAATVIGLNPAGNGTLTVTGIDSSYTATGGLSLGGEGTGVVHVLDQGHLETSGGASGAGLNIGFDSTGYGTLNISGDATVNNQFQTNLGLSGTGILNISSGSFTTSDNGLANPALSIARFTGSEGDLNVSGTGVVTTVGEIIVGGDGIGTMTITDDGFVDSIIDTDAPAIVGFGSSATGNILIDGPSAEWHVTDALVVGQQGFGTVELTDGGRLYIDDTVNTGDPYLYIGEAAGSFGTVRVSDEFSYLEAFDIPIILGKDEEADGTLEVFNQSEAFVQHTTVGGEGYGEVYVDGASTLTTGTMVIADKSTSEGYVEVREDSALDVLGQLIVGHESGGDAFNELYIADSAVTVLEFIVVGNQADSDGSIYIESFEDGGSSSIGGTLTALTVGNLGSGLLDISGNSTVTINGPTDLAVELGSTGTLDMFGSATFTTTGTFTVGNEGDATADMGGTISSGTVFIAKTGGTSFAGVNFGTWTVNDSGPDNGSVFVGGSDTALGGSGQLFVEGTLTVNNRVKIWNGSTARLSSGGTINAAAVVVLGDLRGNGTVDAPTTTLSGVIAPANNAGSNTGKLTIDGNLDFDPSGRFQVEIGGTTPETEFDVIDVTGDVTLDGFLDVFLINGFTLAPGQTFDILNVTGSLTGLIEGHTEGDVVGTFGGTDLFITYAGGDISLFTMAGLVADTEPDGDVDGADFLALQRDNSSLIPTWQTEYGSGSSSFAYSSQVPEPAAIGLLLLGLSLFPCLRNSARV
ncbi:beta strand repeat-containing protein [Adhaeretor mobilis]|uniref:Autotransporter-associated beta strand repeat protein n=1 Tax=Adhaeretor mobilis TaxID=1930276 RepID=A0A517N361_9BACT|nr:hypothetical protein [Adhaeretor mobilis]QDT01580.1 hypothetical protein HG15A2_49270 [Adhaeretor mobilis]